MAQKKSKSKKGMSAKTAAGVGIGLTATAATVAGAYFLYGSKNAPKNRKKVKSWALKAKGEVLEALENVEELTEEEYKKLVQSATGVYGTVKNATRSEVEDFKKEMLTHWKDLQKSSAVKKLVHKKPAKKKAAKKSVKKAAKKTAKKATKKVAKKSAKKRS